MIKKAKAGFLFLGADTPWVRGLCEALTKRGYHAIGVSFVGFQKYWSSSKINEAHICDDHFVFVPPAYGTRLAWLTGNYLTAVITRRFLLLDETNPGAAWLVATNPVAERWTRAIPNERLIYWNYDDYSLYSPRRASQVRDWEDELIVRARIVLCAAHIQLSRFLARHPGQTSRFFHFPNAVRSDWVGFLKKRHIQPNTVGYVGGMGDRVDWRLVHETVNMLPNVQFIFAGSIKPQIRIKERDEVLALKNVKAIGQISHEKLAAVYQSFAVNWMPYDVAHPFNLASCPTKIFDALATGRPFISTDLPECQRYSEYIRIVGSPVEAKNAILGTLADWTSYSEKRQLAFARLNDWEARADFLIELVGA